MWENFSTESDSEIERIGSRWNKLRKMDEEKPERSDSIGKDRIQGSLYAWNSERDDACNVEHLLRHTKDAYLGELGEERYEKAYREIIDKLREEREVAGVDVLQVFESYL